MSSKQAQQSEKVATIRCHILTPLKTVLDKDVLWASIPTTAGVMEIYPKHEATVAPLKIGIMSITMPDNEVIRVAIHGGYMDTDGSQIVVLADSAEFGGDINTERARAALARAKELLANVTHDDPKTVAIDIDRAKLAIMRAMNRIELSELQAKPLSGQQ